MIKKLQKEDAVEVLRRIYKDSSTKTLIIDDGSSSGWQETDRFPKMGECELLIKDIQIPENLHAFLTEVREYYSTQKEARFLFLEEEYVKARETIEVECDEASLDEILKFVDDAPNFDAVLVDASFSWVLKLHHESFGYFTGSNQICNALKSNQTLSRLLQNPVIADGAVDGVP
ncbi:MAG: hypothetical protein QOF62_913 [Pyrinomonadaceae bacterium]|jgi:hypothetical protein|nr:hypothetical protein [Pyrinomonadaceae bacterium]